MSQADYTILARRKAEQLVAFVTAFLLVSSFLLLGATIITTEVVNTRLEKIADKIDRFNSNFHRASQSNLNATAQRHSTGADSIINLSKSKSAFKEAVLSFERAPVSVGYPFPSFMRTDGEDSILLHLDGTIGRMSADMPILIRELNKNARFQLPVKIIGNRVLPRGFVYDQHGNALAEFKNDSIIVTQYTLRNWANIKIFFKSTPYNIAVYDQYDRVLLCIRKLRSPVGFVYEYTGYTLSETQNSIAILGKDTNEIMLPLKHSDADFAQAYKEAKIDNPFFTKDGQNYEVRGWIISPDQAF